MSERQPIVDRALEALINRWDQAKEDKGSPEYKETTELVWEALKKLVPPKDGGTKEGCE